MENTGEQKQSLANERPAKHPVHFQRRIGFLYVIANPVGLGRVLSRFIHWMGLYERYPDGRCMWCGMKY